MWSSLPLCVSKCLKKKYMCIYPGTIPRNSKILTWDLYRCHFGKRQRKNPWCLLLRNWKMAGKSHLSFSRTCSSCHCIGLFSWEEQPVETTAATPLPCIFLPESERCFYLESATRQSSSFRSGSALGLEVVKEEDKNSQWLLIPPQDTLCLISDLLYFC